MNKKYAYAFAALTLGLTACSNEDLTSPAENQVAGKTVHVTLTVNRPSDNTRTVVGENSDGLSLYSKWASGDELLVVNSEKKEVGKLTIDEGSIGESEGVFSGEAKLDNTEKYTLVYLGGKNGEAGAYASWTDGTGISNPVATPDSENGFTVSGAKADLCRADLMKKEGVQFLVSGETAYPTDNVSLDAVNAMAHFTLTGIPETLDADAVLTVNYGEVKHTISNISEQLYLPMPTGNFAISFNLSNGDDTYTASINEGNEVTVDSGLYYVDTDNSGLNGKGIEVALDKVATTPLAEGVGPVIEYGGKKWKFTWGNLTYNVKNHEWSILSDQSQYVYACGLGQDKINSDNTIPSAGLGATPDVIGLFSWGATGLEDARKPWSIRFDSYTKTVAGSNWPSTITSNSTITNLLANDYVYDWGHAYELSGRHENDKRQYITPPASVFETLMSGSFVQGATIKGVGENGSDVTGIICIPNCDLESVKTLINNTNGVTYSSQLKNVLHNNSGSTLNYNYITITDYSAIKKLNDAVFFPSCGKMMLNAGSVTKTSTKEGWYWSATGIGSTGNNAKNLHFYATGDSNGQFFYKADVINGTVQSNRANNIRYVKMAVRLLVEVDDE